jgi:hypothetical protein
LRRKEYLRINNRLIKENYLCATKWDELNFVEKKDRMKDRKKRKSASRQINRKR